jgi:hypothetical protein
LRDAPGASADSCSPQRRTSPASGAQPGQSVQQRGLAGAVAAKNRQAFAGVELEVEATDEGATADGGGEVARFEQGAHSRPPFGWRESK